MTVTPRLRDFLFITLGAAFWLFSVAPQTLSAQQDKILPDYVIETFGAPPATPSGALSADVLKAVDRAVADGLDQDAWVQGASDAYDVLIASGDPRVAWILVDLMRFSWRADFRQSLGATAADILQIDLRSARHRAEITDYLLAWEIPAYPDYLADKRAIYTNYLPRVERIFMPGDIAWERVSWGGVNIDDRPFEADTGGTCQCIPAADNPDVSSVAEATWLDDDDVVFGISVNGEHRAYPRRIMEIREMINDTLGGRDLGIPYCTLCGAAQAYFTDGLPAGVDRPILRTSGMLIRSNKVMYDLTTYSVFDTFLGKAVTGPLAEKGIVLEQAGVVTTTWGDWRKAHPDTTVLVEELALGRDFDLRNTRDANGPIFPVGDVDPRLTVQADVIGVVSASGTPVAFERAAAFAALTAGSTISFENVRLVLDGGGIRAVDDDGTDLGSHQAFWFAWSQFHPDTVLWPE